MRLPQRYIIFDLAGTIVSSKINWERENLAGARLMVTYLQSFGIKFPYPDVFIEQTVSQARQGRQRAKKTRIEYDLKKTINKQLASLKVPLSEDILKKAFTQYLKPELELTFPYQGMTHFLSDLNRAGYQLFLVSNTPAAEFLARTISRHNLAKYFSYILTSREVGYRKPHPRFLNHLINHGKPDLNHSIFIGDRLQDDILSAQRLGIKGILFNKVDHPDNVKQRGVIIPDAEASNLIDLREAIKDVFTSQLISHRVKS